MPRLRLGACVGRVCTGCAAARRCAAARGDPASCHPARGYAAGSDAACGHAARGGDWPCRTRAAARIHVVFEVWRRWLQPHLVRMAQEVPHLRRRRHTPSASSAPASASHCGAAPWPPWPPRHQDDQPGHSRGACASRTQAGAQACCQARPQARSQACSQAWPQAWSEGTWPSLVHSRSRT